MPDQCRLLLDARVPHGNRRLHDVAGGDDRAGAVRRDVGLPAGGTLKLPGSGSIQMRELLLPWRAGKISVLVLLGFAGNDLMITIALLAADGTARTVENSFAPA